MVVAEVPASLGRDTTTGSYSFLGYDKNVCIDSIGMDFRLNMYTSAIIRMLRPSSASELTIVKFGNPTPEHPSHSLHRDSECPLEAYTGRTMVPSRSHSEFPIALSSL